MTSPRSVLPAAAAIFGIAAATLAASLSLASPLSAQAASASQAQNKVPLTASDFDAWRSIDGERLSADGKWVLYSLVPQVGEGEVVVRSADSDREFRHSRGYIGRPQMRPGASRGDAQRFPAAQFFGDSYVVFQIEPPRAEVERARHQKKKSAQRPRSSLGIMNLSDGKVTVIPDVKSWAPPRGDGAYLIYLLQGDSADQAADSSRRGAAAATPGGQPRPISDSASARGKKKKDLGSTMVIRNLATGSQVTVENVLEMQVDDQGTQVSYIRSTPDGDRDGIYLRKLGDDAEQAVLTGEGKYRQLTFDDEGKRVAFVSARGKAEEGSERYALFLAETSNPQSRQIVAAGYFDSLVISSRANVDFSEDGARLEFGVMPPPLDSIPADSLADKAVFDLWHWKDTRLQPQQRLEAQRDRNRSWPAIYDIASKRTHLIGGDSLPSVRFSRDLRWAVGLNPLPYEIQEMWGEGGNDVYLINTLDNTHQLIIRKAHFGASLSPASRYVVYFDTAGDWNAYSAKTGRTTNLTSGLANVHFDQETWDTPSEPRPWGIAAWTDDDRSVLVYDRYDIWELDPAGERPPRMVTDSIGRQRGMVFRYVELDTARQTIDPSASLYLSAFNEVTKASGFWRDKLGDRQKPESLYMAPKRLSRPIKATEADRLLYTASTFTEFPDLRVSDLSMRHSRKVSDANPQQSRYRWGTAELVHWRSADGVPLQGILYKPDDFDPSRKYPMVVYFYEQLSDNLYQYNMSFPRNTIQPTYYVSNGYLAFFPDITYTDGYPGPSAVKSVVPGVQMLIDSGFVKEDGVGIAGQSWGGYQVAFMVTQTNLFKAAFAGAPVANMTSAYGGIRWGSGLARSFQYEKTQSRIGGSLWEMPMRYLDNSPLFMADRIETPLLIMHNDADGAVPWYQGIEFFVALRRLGKEAYMVTYNDEAHNPTKRANQQDIAMRMKQFFDHHLMGAPAPRWMVEGIPFLQKGRGQPATNTVVTEEQTSESKSSGG